MQGKPPTVPKPVQVIVAGLVMVFATAGFWALVHKPAQRQPAATAPSRSYFE